MDAEFRDPTGTFWPQFAYGNPVGGQLIWKDNHPQGSFEVAATKWCQPNGDQSRRILGPLIPASKQALPIVALRVASLGPLTSREVTVENKGKPAVRELSYFEADAEFEVAGKVIKVRPQCMVRPGNVVESGIRKLQMYAYFTVKGKELGLGGERANLDIDVRLGMQCHAGEPITKKKR